MTELADERGHRSHVGEVTSEKVVPIQELAAICARERARGARIVHCHGCFDGLHMGHVRHLRSAASFGDLLVVSVTVDDHVDKGPGRPVFGHALRMEFLAELGRVDWVTPSEGASAELVIEAIRPSIFAKGQEYSERREGTFAVEAAAVRRFGGQVRFTDEPLVLSSRALMRPRDSDRPLVDESTDPADGTPPTF